MFSWVCVYNDASKKLQLSHILFFFYAQVIDLAIRCCAIMMQFTKEEEVW